MSKVYFVVHCVCLLIALSIRIHSANGISWILRRYGACCVCLMKATSSRTYSWKQPRRISAKAINATITIPHSSKFTFIATKDSPLFYLEIPGSVFGYPYRTSFGPLLDTRYVCALFGGNGSISTIDQNQAHFAPITRILGKKKKKMMILVFVSPKKKIPIRVVLCLSIRFFWEVQISKLDPPVSQTHNPV